MPQFVVLILLVILLAIVAYFTGGMRPCLGVLGAGVALVIIVALGGLF